MRILVALAVVASCGGNSSSQPPQAQSFRDGMQALCDLPDHVPDNGEHYTRRLAAAAEWAARNVTNPEAKQIGDVKSFAANKDAFAAAVAKAGIPRCKLLDNGMELQSFADAMKIICDGRGNDPSYFKSHLLNAEVVKMIGALGDVSPVDRVARMKDAMARAHLDHCMFMEGQNMSPGVPVPKVADLGLVDVGDNSAVLVITPTGIVVEGKAIVSVSGGDVDPAEKEGGSLGILIPRLRKFAKALAEFAVQRDPKKPLAMNLVLDPTTPYRLLIEVLFSTKQAGYKSFAIVVTAGTATKAIPIELPDKTATKVAGLGMVVSITKDHLVVWSISGQEGTLKAPKLQATPDHIADVQKALAEIAERRWHGGNRGDADRRVLVMADGAIPAQQLADVLVAVRTSADGKPLFPTVHLSSGFE